MTATQLKFDLWQQLSDDQPSPQTADWQQLCLALIQTPASLQLAIAADAIEQMAEVLEARAAALAEEWQRLPGDGPVMDFSNLVRQSFYLNLDGLVAEPELYVRTNVAEISKKKALEFTYEPEPEPTLTQTEAMEAITQLECDENVGAWAEILLDWLRSNNLASAALVQLEQYTGLSMVKLLLAGLLEQDKLEIQVDQGRQILERFYDQEGVAIALIA